MKKIILPILLLILASAGLKANAQTPAPSPVPSAQQDVQPADENDVVRVTTNLIQIDALVTDKKGRVVTNLKPEDFEIFVNGKPQPITNFSFVTVEPTDQPFVAGQSPDRNAPPSTSVALRPEQVKRTIAIVIDDLTIACGDMLFIKKALKKFVAEEMLPGDLVAIIRAGKGIGSLQQFTSDKQRLYAAIEGVKFNPAVDTCFDAGGQKDKWDGELKTSQDDGQFKSDVLASASLSATRYVVEGMRDLPGRKAVMLLSGGFLMFKRDYPEYNTRIRVSIERLVDSAVRAGVVLYTMDARGLIADIPSNVINVTSTPKDIHLAVREAREKILAPQDGLVYLAKQAGGFAVLNTNDFSGGIRKALDDQKSYYLLGYQPDASIFDPGKSRFNQLRVKVKGSGLNVRYRSGFFGIKEEEKRVAANTPQQQIMKALTSPFAAGDINLRFTPLFTNDAVAGSLVRSLVHIPAKDLSFTVKPDGMHEAVINIVAYTFDDSGKVADSVGETHTISLNDKLYQRALGSGLVYSVNVPIKTAGAYQLRVAVRDDRSQKVGTASQFINVPDIRKERLTLSGIALSSYDLKEEKSITNASYKQSTVETSGHTLLTQGAVRRFRSGHVLQFAYAIYNAQLDKSTNLPQLTTQVRLYRDGKEIYAGKATAFNAQGQLDMKRLVAEGGLQLGGLTEGEYVLQIVVTDALAKGKHQTTTNWIDFEVVK
jgi:VWFA-related protein